jgi:hypothetical protein
MRLSHSYSAPLDCKGFCGEFLRSYVAANKIWNSHFSQQQPFYVCILPACISLVAEMWQKTQDVAFL